MPTVRIYPTDDTWAWNGEPDLNKSDTSTLRFGIHESSAHEAWFHFDLSSIPAGAKVTGATFRVFQTLAVGTTTISLHEVTGSWVHNTLTWTNRPPKSSTELDVENTTGGTSYMYWDTQAVADVVQAWHSGARPNYGFNLARSSTTTASAAPGCRAINSGESTDEKTYLDVTYNEAPSVPTSLAPSGATGTNTVTLSAVVSDPAGENVRAQFRVSGTTYDGNTVASGGTSTYSFAGAANTTYSLDARTVDAAGLTSAYTAQQSFTTNRPPSAPTVTAPNGGETINTTATVSWSAGSDPDGQALVYDVDLTTDGGSTWSNLKTDFSGTSFTHDFTNVPASTACRVRVRSQDTQGAVSAWDESNANFTIEHNRAPTAPILGSPANGSTQDLAAGYTFTYTATDPDSGDAASAWAFRRKISGAAAYEYWNAGTGAWQSTVQWNTNPAGSVAFASGKWTNGNTYNWSVATKDTQGLEGPFAADFSVAASSVATTTVTDPSGSVTTTSRPLVRWTLTQPEGEPQQTYQVRVFSQAQYSVTGFDPATSPATWETAEVTSSGAREIQVGTDLVNQQTYRAYVRLKAANLHTAWANSQFSMALTAPRPPVLTVTDEPTSPFGPRVRIDARMDPGLNLLTGNQASLETDTTGVQNLTNATLARSTAQAFDGTASLSMTASAAGTMGAFWRQAAAYSQAAATPVVAGQVYTATAQLRAATTARSAYLRLYWYNATDELAVVNGPKFADNAAGWAQLRFTAQAPAGAVAATLALVIDGCAASEVHYVDAVGLFTDPLGNLVTNPDFENGTAGWEVGAAGTTITHSTADAYTGRSSGLFAGDAGLGAFTVLRFPTVVGQTYTGSAWVKSKSGTADLRFDLRQSNHGTWAAASVLRQPTATWTRYIYTGVATTTTSEVLLQFVGAGTQEVYVDAVQVVVGSEPVDYLPPTTHNLVTNPSAEVNTAGWTANGSGATLARDTTQAYVGSASFAVTSGSSGLARLSGGFASTVGVTYTLSAWIKGVAGRRIEVSAGSGIVVVAASGAWERLSATFTGDGDDQLLAGYTTNAGDGTLAVAGDVVYVDAVQVEQGSVATPYVDGSLGGGYRWDASENLLSAAASSFEDGTTGGWVSGATLANSTAAAYVGTQSLRFTGAAGAAHYASRDEARGVNAQTYTVSAWVRSDTARTVRFRVESVNEAITAITGSSSNVDTALSANTWTRLVVTYTTPATGDVTYLRPVITNEGYTATDLALYIDAVQVEQRPYATAYAAPGTAHASTSTRQHRFEPGGFTQTMTYLVERSEDGGSVWEAVRDAEALPVDVQQRAVVYDYEPRRGQPVLYRASTVADV